LVTCNHPFLQLPVLAGTPAHFVRNYSGSRAAIFTSPLSPAFDRFLYQALLFSISGGLCLYYFRLYGLWSSSLPGEKNTAVSERPYGPDWHCGTLLGPSA
jgi:hypothetical protein